jgi:hypothetical protein
VFYIIERIVRPVNKNVNISQNFCEKVHRLQTGLRGIGYIEITSWVESLPSISQKGGKEMKKRATPFSVSIRDGGNPSPSGEVQSREMVAMNGK